MMKKYCVYMDDGENTFKCYIPAESKKAVHSLVQGNGEIISIKEIEMSIDLDKICTILKDNGITGAEYDFIMRTLQYSGICE